MAGLRLGLGLSITGHAAAPALTPLAVSDFKNASYSIGGVPKLYADLWKVPKVWGANTISVVADEGLVNSYTGTTTSASGTVTGQADLNAAINNPAVGHSGVISVSLEGVSDLKMIALTLSDASGSGGLEARSTVGGAKLIRTPGPASSAFTDALDYAGGLNKLAYTMTPATLSLSVNGGQVVTVAAPPWDAGITLAKIYSTVYNAPAGGKVTVERIDFYAPQDDASLQALSA